MWKIFDSGEATAEENMRIDEELLQTLNPTGFPILHFYDWQGPSATYGYFLKPERFLDLKKAKEQNLTLARRPTGGGIVFHVSDLAFSVLIPSGHPGYHINPLDNYNYINNSVLKAVKTFFEHSKIPHLLPEEPLPLDDSCRHFCMAKPTKYDVMYEGKKIAGASQRKRKQGYLHQGSIAIALPQENFLNSILLPGTRVAEAMQQNTFSILGSEWTGLELQKVREELKKYIKEAMIHE